MSKELSRRDFLKIAGLGLGGAAIGGTVATLIDLAKSNHARIEQFEETSKPTNKRVVKTTTNTPEANKQSSTPEPTSIATTEKTATSEPTEVPKEYEFRIGEVRLDQPFLIILPGSISGDLVYPKGLEIPIYEPVANRQKIGWPTEMDTIYRNYQEHYQTALVAESDIWNHDVVNLHSFSFGGKLLPGEVFRRVKDRESIKGESFQITQLKSEGDGWIKAEQGTTLEIVDVSQVEGHIYESSVGRPDESYGLQKFVFFRSDMWGLDEGDKARQPNQVTLVTCDGRYVEDNLSKFATRLLVTVELKSPLRSKIKYDR